MKLELKHLAPYLPYKLKFQHPVLIWSGNPPEPSHDEIGESEMTCENLLSVIDDGLPILKSLSDLLMDDDTILEIFNESWIAGQHDIVKKDDVISIIPHEDDHNLNIFLRKPHCNLEWINDILYKYHYDLKGLINKGLAVDYNSLNK